MKHIKHLFWRRGRFAVVSDELIGYMRRWMLWTPWGTLRLHHILSSDDNRDLHDHPWDFASLIVGRDWRDLLSALLGLTVTAGYTEHLPRGGRRWCPAGTVVRHLAADLHRLVLREPVYTLVVTGPVLRDWGFCAVCSAPVPGSDRLAARLRGRYADKQPHQHTLPPGQHTLTLVRGSDVSEVDVVIRPRTEADNLPPDAPFVVEVVAVRGSTILPVGHVEAVRMSVDSVVVDGDDTMSQN